MVHCVCGHKVVKQRRPTRLIGDFRHSTVSYRDEDRTRLPDRLTGATDRWSITVERLPSDLEANCTAAVAHVTSYHREPVNQRHGGGFSHRGGGGFFPGRIIPGEFIWPSSSNECGSRGRWRSGRADVPWTSWSTTARYLRSYASHDYDPTS